MISESVKLIARAYFNVGFARKALWQGRANSIPRPTAAAHRAAAHLSPLKRAQQACEFTVLFHMRARPWVLATLRTVG